MRKGIERECPYCGELLITDTVELDNDYGIIKEDPNGVLLCGSKECRKAKRMFRLKDGILEEFD